jgi:hypothetical protein
MMSTKSREFLFGARIRGAKIRAESAREIVVGGTWHLPMRLTRFSAREHDDPLQRERRILQAGRFQWKDGAAKVLNAYENLIG